MYIYGGLEKGGVSQDLWSFDFKTSLWEIVPLKVSKF